MVHGTFATVFVRENFRNFTHLWQYDGTRTWMYGLAGSMLFMSWASRVSDKSDRTCRPHH